MDDNTENSSARNVMIFYRLKPSNDFSYENIKVQNDYKAVHVKRMQDISPKILTPPLYLEYKCESVFYRHPQRIVYNAVMKNVLARAIEGSDATILVYGQTGAGKTSTMTGLRNSFEDTGIIPRFFAEMFDVQLKRANDWYIIYKMSYVELIEPDDVNDLLVPTKKKERAKLLYQDRLKNTSSLMVPSENDALRLLFYGESQRLMEENAPYPGANRSHIVLTINVEATSTIQSQAEIYCGKIHFVDMMGTNCANNERCHLPPRVQGQANLAKMLLEQFLDRLNTSKEPGSLSQNWTSIVLDYLGESLNRRSVMRIIGHVHGSFKDLEITHSTLRFGSFGSALKPLALAKRIQVDPAQQKINDQEERAALIKHLMMTRACHKEITLNNGYAQLSAARVEHLRRLVPQFLLGDLPLEVIISLQQTPMFVYLCREHIGKMKREQQEDTVLLAALREEEAEALMQAKTSLESGVFSGSQSSLRHGSNKSKESQTSLYGYSKQSHSKSTSKNAKSLERAKRDSAEEKKSKMSNKSTKAKASYEETLRCWTGSVTFPLHLPTHSSTWDMFVDSSNAISDMLAVINAADAAYRLSVKNLEAARTAVMKASQESEEVRKKLYLAQNVRHLRNGETSTSRGIVEAGDNTSLEALCKEKEAELNSKGIEMHMQCLNKNEMEKNLINTRRKIATQYRSFCLDHFGVPSPDLGGGIVENDHLTDKTSEIFYNKLKKRMMLNSNSRSKSTLNNKVSSREFFSNNDL